MSLGGVARERGVRRVGAAAGLTCMEDTWGEGMERWERSRKDTWGEGRGWSEGRGVPGGETRAGVGEGRSVRRGKEGCDDTIYH